MATKAVFEGLVFDEAGNPAEVVYVGQEACYVVDDNGFRRHIPSEDVDRQVLNRMMDSIQGHEDLLTEQAAKMLGQEDIFSKAMIAAQFKNIHQQFEALLHIGLPEEIRAYLGMMGFRIVINIHGEVIEFIQPGLIADDEGED